MIIFIDFDGVLHGVQAIESEGFAHVQALEVVLREFPDVQIVISSSWRYHENLDQLRAHFSADIAKRIVGVTPTLMPTWQEYARFLEISAWIEQNDYWGDWIAIDDQYGEFPQVGEGLDIQEQENFNINQKWHPNLIWCRKRFGLRQVNLDELRRRLTKD
jgi:HAD domain in Swiss Army Knife RNA repair proteins